jgi:hypothetical protein
MIDFAYINFEHGGGSQGSYLGTPGPFDMSGLVRILGEDQRWPDIAVIGEGERWEFDGGAGLSEATTALSEASGRPYASELGTLAREWGPIGPAIIWDAAKINKERFYSGREPDFYARNRNLFIGSVRGERSKRFHVVAHHGHIHDSDQQLADNKGFRRYATEDIPCAILADWNSVLSGNEPGDLNTPGVYPPWRLVPKIVWQWGPQQAGPHVLDTRPRVSSVAGGIPSSASGSAASVSMTSWTWRASPPRPRTPHPARCGRRPRSTAPSSTGPGRRRWSATACEYTNPWIPSTRTPIISGFRSP